MSYGSPEYLRGDMESKYNGLALYGSKNECARTNNVFFPKSEVCNDTVSLKKSCPSKRRAMCGSFT